MGARDLGLGRKNLTGGAVSAVSARVLLGCDARLSDELKGDTPTFPSPPGPPPRPQGATAPWGCAQNATGGWRDGTAISKGGSRHHAIRPLPRGPARAVEPHQQRELDSSFDHRERDRRPFGGVLMLRRIEVLPRDGRQRGVIRDHEQLEAECAERRAERHISPTLAGGASEGRAAHLGWRA
jgi:hypothetical protein